MIRGEIKTELHNDMNRLKTDAANAPDTMPVRAKLKWFNGPKGFGFVNPEEDPKIDAFLHVTTLQDAGLQILGEEALVECIIDHTDKGAQVRQIMKVIEPGILPEGVETHLAPKNKNLGKTEKMGGTVKWYKESEGFGFIVPDDGKKDVFVHKSVLDKLDLESLQAGQRVRITFRIVPKGRELVGLTFEN